LSRDLVIRKFRIIEDKIDSRRCFNLHEDYDKKPRFWEGGFVGFSRGLYGVFYPNMASFKLTNNLIK